MVASKSGLTYAQTGVDIDAGNALVERIKPLAKATVRAGVMEELGGFGALFDLKSAGYVDPILVSATDGVGTKLKIAIETGFFETIGIDLVAMCVNDLVCQGAEPLFFLDYFATGRLDIAQAEKIIAGISLGCRASGAALIGGESAEMPGLYSGSDFDLAGFSVGAVERTEILPQKICAGDVLIGFASSGVHSNGFSLLRRVVEKTGLDWGASVSFSERPLGLAVLTPTRLYVQAALKGLKAGGVRGYVHITGGGLDENLPRILPKGLGAEIAQSGWKVPAVFKWLADKGKIDEAEMRRSFNMGVGFVAIVEPQYESALVRLWQDMGETVFKIGTVSEEAGLRFSGALL